MTRTTPTAVSRAVLRAPPASLVARVAYVAGVAGVLLSGVALWMLAELRADVRAARLTHEARLLNAPAGLTCGPQEVGRMFLAESRAEGVSIHVCADTGAGTARWIPTGAP